MTELANERCEACRAGAPTVNDVDAKRMLRELPGWRIREVDGVPRLEKSYALRDFAQALELTNRVGEIAESENHHPLIVLEWGRATVAWWTHKIGGLHRNDFIMAARTEQLATEG